MVTEKLFKTGDIVIISDPNQTYPTYLPWVEAYKPHDLKWARGERPEYGWQAIVRILTPHKSKGDMLCGVEAQNGMFYVISEKGLFKV